MRDLAIVLRSLRNSYGFTTAIIATLALAIGANTIIVSAVEAVVLRPFPVPGIERVLDIGLYDPRFAAHYGLNPAETFDLETRTDLFDAVGGYRTVDVNLTGIGQSQRISGVATTGNFFGVFGVVPYLGRLYDDRDERLGATNVVVLSYGFWRVLTGGDKHALGRTIRLNDSSLTLIGVLPPEFSYPLGVQLWTPRPLDGFLNRRANQETQHGGGVVPTIARMRTDVTRAHVRGALTAAMARWTQEQPQFYATRSRQSIEARSLVDTWAERLRPILAILVAAVALVLLIACANVASLQLLRTTGRAHEISIRLALGASRGDIVRLFVTESAILALAGGVCGVAAGWLTLTTCSGFAASALPELYNVRVDPFVLMVAAATTMCTAIAFGTAPALRALRNNSRDVLCDGVTRTASTGRQRNRFLHGAVIVQIALALVLLLGCLTATRSLVSLLDVNPGFDADGVTTARVVFPASHYFPAQTIDAARRSLAQHEALLAEVRATPGFSAVGFTDVTPFSYLARGTRQSTALRSARSLAKRE
ncbi:MAG: ABC transporter permease [Gemmatimonadaceae bacterium]